MEEERDKGTGKCLRPEWKRSEIQEQVSAETSGMEERDAIETLGRTMEEERETTGTL